MTLESKRGFTPQNAGFIRLFVLVLAVVLILSFFGVDLRSLVASTHLVANLSYLWELTIKSWAWLVALVSK